MDMNMLWTQVIMVVVSALLGGGLIWMFFWKYKKGSLIWKLARQKVENEQKLYKTLEDRVLELSGLYQVTRSDLLEATGEIHMMKMRNKQFRKDVGILFKSCRCTETDEIKEIRKRYNEAKDQDS